MANEVRIGLDASLNRNTGNYASPTWAEMTNVRDVTLTLEKDEADVTVRGNNGWEAIVATLKRATIEFEMVAKADDTDLTAIKDAFLNNTILDMAVMDTTVTTNGAQGLRAEMQVLSFTRSEPLTEGLTYSVRMKPTLATNAPTWMTVGS